ncbi:MAG: HEAT repeat domain-containing protein [Myxococcales bacterium]|nr:MAG: HEAT repeat domain-containing protein [Myxococcales bacterium]
MGQYRDAKAVPLLIEQLNEGGVVRRAAALALSAIGSPGADSAKAKLLDVLPKCDERDQSQVVWALAVLGERAAADAIVEAFSEGRLQSQPGFDPKVIVDAVGVTKLANDKLLKHDQEAVRLLVAQALAEEASPAVVGPLKTLLDQELAREPADQSQEVLRAAVAGLGRTGDPSAAARLFALFEQKPGMKASVMESLRKSTAAPGLITLFKLAKDLDSKQQLVRFIRLSHDPRAKEFLVGLLKDEDDSIQKHAAFGLAEMGDSSANALLLGYAAGDDDPLAIEALQALRNVAQEPDVSA